MKKILALVLALSLGTAGLLWSAASTRNETVIWNFVNGIKIAGVSLSQDGLTTFTNLDTIDDATLGTFMFGRPTAGTVIITAKDDNSTAALTVLPGGAAAMTVGGTSTTKVDVITDGGTITFDGAATTLPATYTETAATALNQSGGGSARTLDAVGGRMTMVAAQTIGAGGIVAADMCGGIKRISSAGVVTTDTTDSFTAPAAGNAGCVMHVCNTGANNITLDNNAHFKSIGGADIVMTPDDCTTVGSDGTVWRSLGSLVAN